MGDEKGFDAADILARESPSSRGGEDVILQITRLEPAGPGFADVVGDRAQCAGAEANRLLGPAIEPRMQIFIGIKDGEIAATQPPKDSLHMIAWRRDHCRIAGMDDREAMVVEARHSDRLRARAATRHAGNIHVRTESEIEAHPAALCEFDDNRIDRKRIAFLHADGLDLGVALRAKHVLHFHSLDDA